MKKIFAIIIILFFTNTVYSMIPGPSILVKCPQCGEDKELMSIISGNTFGSIMWSDSYQYTPMLPRLSPVQKCANCGVYFMLPDEKPRYKEDDDSGYNNSFETGRLNFPEIKEAVVQLENSGLDKDQEIALRIEAVYRFNDAFRKFDDNEQGQKISDELKERSTEDWQFHRENLLKLISLLDKEDIKPFPLIAELYRELGMFEESLQVIESFTPSSEFIKDLMDKIKEKNLAKDSKIFVLEY